MLNQQELAAEAGRVAAAQATPGMSSTEKDELLELAMMKLLDKGVAPPFFGRVAQMANGGPTGGGGRYLMHEEPRLPAMPEKPTLIDFFERRFLINKRGGNHLLQSAALARRNGLPDKLVLACLLHDVAVVAHVRTDHGYYGAQLVEPYVDEETVFAIRYHQALRFYPDAEYKYEYPDLYTRSFGEEYRPPAYVREAYDYARGHKWYASARLVTCNDLYSFDPNVKVEIREFEDIIGRTFKAPKEGLGFDGSPVAHMWRSIIWPNNFL